MSETSPLDPAVLAKRARDLTGADSSLESLAGLTAMAATLDELMVGVANQREPWVLPSDARMQGARSAALRVLKVFTDQQQQLDSTLVSATLLLVEYCRALETQVELLTARVDAIEAVDQKDGIEA